MNKILSLLGKIWLVLWGIYCCRFFFLYHKIFPSCFVKGYRIVDSQVSDKVVVTFTPDQSDFLILNMILKIDILELITFTYKNKLSAAVKKAPLE